MTPDPDTSAKASRHTWEKHTKWSCLQHFPKDPSVLKTLRDNELLCCSVFTTCPMFSIIYYAANLFLRGELPVKPMKMTSAQGGHDSKSLCDCEFITHSNSLRRCIFSTAGSFGLQSTEPCFCRSVAIQMEVYLRIKF